MKKKLINSFVLLASSLGASAVFAEGADPSSSHGLAKLGAAIAIGLGAFGAATGQGKAASEALAGIARNPTSRGDVFVPLITALAFMETQALFSFVIALLLLG